MQVIFSLFLVCSLFGCSHDVWDSGKCDNARHVLKYYESDPIYKELRLGEGRVFLGKSRDLFSVDHPYIIRDVVIDEVAGDKIHEMVVGGIYCSF